MSGSVGTISLITKTGEFERKYFLNNPDITFFKSVYRKHTNFSKYFKIESLAPENSTDLQKTYKIQTGSEDLLAKIYLENKITIKNNNPDVANLEIFANLGSNFIEDNDNEALSITIGHNRYLFKSYGLFQEVKGELLNQMSLTFDSGSGTHAPELECNASGIISCKSGSHYNYTTLSGGVRGTTIPKSSFTSDIKNTIQTEYFYTIPEFSFMKDYGLALPLLCMRNDPIQFNVKFKPKEKLIKSSTGDSTDFDLTYESNIIQELIQLDNDEKSRFLTSQLNYLTESITRIDVSSKTQDVKSGFKLCKYILMVGKPNEDDSQFSSSNSLTTPSELKLKTFNINIGGNPLYPGVVKLNSEIFTKMNINKYFPGCGRDLNAGINTSENHGQLDSIAMVPFSIEPLNYTQPSGCISNQGQIGFIKLDIDTKISTDNDPEIILYAINYNILQIADGKTQIQYH